MGTLSQRFLSQVHSGTVSPVLSRITPNHGNIPTCQRPKDTLARTCSGCWISRKDTLVCDQDAGQGLGQTARTATAVTETLRPDGTPRTPGRQPCRALPTRSCSICVLIRVRVVGMCARWRSPSDVNSDRSCVHFRLLSTPSILSSVRVMMLVVASTNVRFSTRLSRARMTSQETDAFTLCQWLSAPNGSFVLTPVTGSIGVDRR